MFKENPYIKKIIDKAFKHYKNGNLKEIYLKKGSGNNFQITYAKKGGFKKIGNNTL